MDSQVKKKIDGLDPELLSWLEEQGDVRSAMESLCSLVQVILVSNERLGASQELRKQVINYLKFQTNSSDMHYDSNDNTPGGTKH